MVKSLCLSVTQVADATGTCTTAASRSVAAAEEILDGCIERARQITRSGRADRMRSKIVSGIRIVGLLATRHPEQLAGWIDRLMILSPSRPSPARKAVR